MSRLSIVILNYGPTSIVTPCLESLKPDFDSGLAEVLVVDNGTPGFNAASLTDRFPWITVHPRSSNDGFAVGNNHGIERSGADYVLLLNPDTTVDKGTMPAMVDFMEEHPDVGAATCRVDLKNGDIDPACHRGFPTPWASLFYFLKLDRLLPQCKLFGGYHLTYEDLTTTHDIDAPSGCFFLVRRRVIEQVGTLDEDYFMYGEDVDWAYRIKEAGWRIVYHPEVSIVHLKGMSSGIKSHSATDSKARLEERRRAHRAFHDAMRIFYRKHYRKRHPIMVSWLVHVGIWLAERLRRRKLRV